MRESLHLLPLLRGWGLAAILPVFFVSCGPSAYRLTGDAVPGTTISLLDSTAVGFVDSMHAAYAHDLRDLGAERDRAIDSLKTAGAALGAPYAEARRRRTAAQKRYADAFRSTMRYLSFGGNPIFTEDDAKTSTDKLLEAIADRFHRGKAFSLEAESALRHLIRDRLIPLESDVRRAQAAVRKVRGSRRTAESALKKVGEDFEAAVAALQARANGALQAGIGNRTGGKVSADSTGQFAFAGLATGWYHVYAPGASPSAWLEPVEVKGHVNVRLLPDRLRVVLVSIDPTDREETMAD